MLVQVLAGMYRSARHRTVIYLSFSFFFSSRRRHTRLQGDWSSDVCSSDLIQDNHSKTNLIGSDGTSSESCTLFAAGISSDVRVHEKIYSIISSKLYRPL